MRFAAALLALPLVTLAGPGLFGQAPILVAVACALVACGGLAWREDPWLALLVGYIVLRSSVQGAAWDVGVLAVVGLVLLLAARELPDAYLPALHAAVAALVSIQVAFAIVQTAGYDPLWLWTTPMPYGATVHGLLGNSNYLGTFLAVSLGFLPGAILPVAVLGIVLSGSYLAALAGCAALLVRYRAAWRWTVPSSVAVLGLLLWLRHGQFESWVYRASVWLFGFGHWHLTWLTSMFGWGPGAWERFGLVASRNDLSREWFAQAHNDYLQFGYEFGIVGVALLAGWLLAWWDAIRRSPYAPSAIALAICAAAMFPFHLTQTAVFGAVVLGAVTRDRAPTRPGKDGKQAWRW